MTATSQRLAKAMEERGLDQSALARELRVSQGTISKIVLGKTTNSRLTPRIASILKVSLPWLLGETDDPQVDAPDESVLTTEERDLLQNFAVLIPADRRAILQIIKSMNGGGGSLHEPPRGFGHGPRA